MLVEEIAVTRFDSDGEPVIKQWSDGSLRIHFEAMPPFFAEDEGTESDFDNFEDKCQDVLGVSVTRDDREVFVIQNPESDTAEKAKSMAGSISDMNPQRDITRPLRSLTCMIDDARGKPFGGGGSCVLVSASWEHVAGVTGKGRVYVIPNHR